MRAISSAAQNILQTGVEQTEGEKPDGQGDLARPALCA